MRGQGSPNALRHLARSIARDGQSAWRWRCGPIAVRRTLFALLIAILSAKSAQAEPTVQLRISWGGGVKTQWRGSITTDHGKLSLVRLLGEESDAPGAVWEEHGRIEIRQPSPQSYDAIDIDVAAPSEATLRIELADSSSSEEAPIPQEIPLHSVLNKPTVRDLDKANNRIRVARISSDPLHVNLSRDHLVFSPGEKLQFEVEPRFLPIAAGTPVQLRTKLISIANGQESNEQEQSGKATADSADPATSVWEFILPDAEGVYEILIEALVQTNWGFPKRLKAIAERRIQLVVIDDHAPQKASDVPVVWTRLMELDPANPAWYERFRSWSLSNRIGPLGSGGMQSWQHPTLGSMTRLKEHRDDQEPPWEAYPLTISHPGTPHVLEVEYPSDIPQTLAVSVVEPNAAGMVMSIGIDSGVFVVDEPMAATAAEMLRHHVIFWPRTASPLVVLANRGIGSPAVYGKIRVVAGPSKLPPLFPVAEPSERLLAGYMGRPLIAENFGAPEALAASIGRSLKDWRTFYLSATRLAEFLQHVGYNGQMLTVMSDGSAIYPSRLLQATPRYDNGELFDSGQDPVRKDVLEMTLRIFDREGIKLIPSLRFDAPLPELESRLRRGGADAEGIRLIGADGHEHGDASRPLATHLPLYNPLNPHVQQAMIAVVHELTERYGKHPSFAGVAIELSADCCTQLPGEAWGFDNDTLKRFEQATKIKVLGAGATRFTDRAQLLAPLPRSRFVAGPEHEQWLKWRADGLAEFYRRMQAELTASRPDTVLYLAATNLFDSREAQQWLRPSLPPKARADEVLLTFGLKPELLQHDRGLVFLKPERILPPGPIADQAVQVAVNRAPELDAAFNRLPATGTLLLNDSWMRDDAQPLKLPSFDQKSPFGRDKTNLMLYSHLLPSARRNRERFIHALATLDAEAIFDGGWLLPVGQEDSLVDLIATYRRLPVGNFQVHTDATLPVTIRSAVVGNSAYSYLVNDSRWPMTVDLSTVLPPGCRVDELSGQRRLPALNADHWQIQLEPFDFVALRFSSPDTKITQARLLPNPELLAFLSSKHQDFKQRLNTLDRPPALPAFTNANFETSAQGGRISGWSLLKGTTGTISLVPEGESTQKTNGKQALLFHSGGPRASLRSDWFEMPPSRRLTVKLWMKLPDPDKPPVLQLVLEGEQHYRMPGPVSFSSSNIAPGDWNWFIFPVKDLPNEGSEKVRFGLDMSGPGDVLVDDILAFGLTYDRDERIQLNMISTVTDGYLGERKVGECMRELNDYWPRFVLSCVPSQGLEQFPNQPIAPQADREEERPARAAGPLQKLFKGRY
ncbi:MAG: family 10 glycosylhydrolase [Pirellulales bacterium]|nr:family 10 glycosylhydrolase [Pirellulales bacterium]